MNREILKKPHKKGISPNKSGRLNEAVHAVSSLNLPDLFFPIGALLRHRRLTAIALTRCFFRQRRPQLDVTPIGPRR